MHLHKYTHEPIGPRSCRKFLLRADSAYFIYVPVRSCGMKPSDQCFSGIPGMGHMLLFLVKNYHRIRSKVNTE